MHPVLLVRPSSQHGVLRTVDCTVIHGDVSDANAVERVVDNADAVIYSIGILREFPDLGISFEALHFVGARRAMDAAERCGVKRFVLMSANGVKADGTDYQRTKYMAEQFHYR